jgi:hypothetical protein
LHRFQADGGKICRCICRAAVPFGPAKRLPWAWPMRSVARVRRRNLAFAYDRHLPNQPAGVESVGKIQFGYQLKQLHRS